MLETTVKNNGTICQLHNRDCQLNNNRQLNNDGINHQLCDDNICQLLDKDDDDCQLLDDDDDCQLWDDEESLYELERDEYYENVLAPQLSTLNRR